METDRSGTGMSTSQGRSLSEVIGLLEARERCLAEERKKELDRVTIELERVKTELKLATQQHAHQLSVERAKVLKMGGELETVKAELTHFKETAIAEARRADQAEKNLRDLKMKHDQIRANLASVLVSDEPEDATSRGEDRENAVSSTERANKRAARSSPTRPATTSTTTKRIKTGKHTDSTEESSEVSAGPSSAMMNTKLRGDGKSASKKDWLLEVVPKRLPYFPQLGDELVYFRQGHELFINDVTYLDIPELLRKLEKSLPYMVDPDLPAVVSGRLVDIDFEPSAFRVFNLKLERTHWETGKGLGNYFFVRHDNIPSVTDFLVLRQFYDKSVRHQWREDDRFRHLTDETWCFGTVLNRKPFDSYYPDSPFQCYEVQWDGLQLDTQCSPWEMEIIPDDFVVPEDNDGGIPATDEEVRNSLYKVQPEDWEPHGNQAAECRRVSRLIESAMKLPIAEAFLTPVDLSAYPEYAYEIAYPMDLSMIKARLDNLFYRRSRAILTDVERIAMNVEKFNQPNSEIVNHARIITKLLTEIVTIAEFRDVNEAYHRLIAEGTQEATHTPQKKQARGNESVTEGDSFDKPHHSNDHDYAASTIGSRSHGRARVMSRSLWVPRPQN